MNEQIWVFAAALVLMIAAYFLVKWISGGRVVLSYSAAEGIVIAVITIACLGAAYVSGQFR